MKPLEFVTAQLRMNPEASFDEVQARGRLENLKIHQTVYGRARSKLGLATPKRPPRPALAEDTDGRDLRNLSDNQLPAGASRMIQDLRSTIVERNRYRVLLQTVLRLFEEVLDGRDGAQREGNSQA